MDRLIATKTEQVWAAYVLLLMLTMRLEWNFSKYSKIAMLTNKYNRSVNNRTCILYTTVYMSRRHVSASSVILRKFSALLSTTI